jgi:hypothetical protein
MFKTEKDAQEFIGKWCSFHDNIWSTKKVWDIEALQELSSDDIQVGWQGQWTMDINECLTAWKPVQKAIIASKSLSFDINTFSKTMVSFTTYQLFETWDKKQLFVAVDFVLDVNNNGKVCRQNGIAKQKYADLFNNILTSYLNAQKK